MLKFGKGYREALSTMTARELSLLEKAFVLYSFGPQQDYLMNGNLISSMYNIMGTKLPVTKIYPNIFENNNDNKNIDTIEEVMAIADRLD